MNQIVSTDLSAAKRFRRDLPKEEIFLMRRNMFLKYSLNNRSQKGIRKVIETINNREKGEYIGIFTT